MGSVNNALRRPPMSKAKDNLIEITINLVVALAVVSTVIKVSL
jgi:hypothetical protein